MRNRFLLSLWLYPLFMLLASCGSKQFTQGKYDDLNEERLLDDQFNESDMKRIADSMIESLSTSQILGEKRKPPIVLVTLVKNKTEEHIDMKSMTDKIRTALIKSGKFKFTEKEAREEIAGEVQYQEQSGYVDASTARKKGKQIGAEY
ncbi:MAG: penicillin-binding protein activator LpoB, partial [Pseudomonadota bacterium]